MKDFKNKTALITGGNSGIGYATAKELVERGAEVIITGRRKDAVEKAFLLSEEASFVTGSEYLVDGGQCV